jgi:hypothetical protein
VRLAGIVLLLIDIFNEIQGHDTMVTGAIVFVGRRWDVVCPEVVIMDVFGSCGLFAEREFAAHLRTHKKLEGIFVGLIEGE